MTLLLLLSCASSFWGDSGRIRFETDLGFGHALGWGPGPSIPWRSAYPIVSGSAFDLYATGWVDSSAQLHEYGPLATAHSFDTNVFNLEESGPDAWACAAVDEGDASVQFQGDADDAVSVRIREPSEVALIDQGPVAISYLMEAIPGFNVLSGTPPDPVLRRLALAEGRSLDLWAAPISSGGEILFHQPEDLLVGASDCAQREGDDDAIELSACVGSLDLSFGGVSSSVVTEVFSSDAELGALELLVVDLGQAQGYQGFNLVAWAIAHRADGTRALQIPCEWSVSPGLEAHLLDDPSFPEARTDIVGIMASDRPFGTTMEDTISATCLGSSASTAVAWTRVETGYQVAPGDWPEQSSSSGGGCLCSSASSLGTASMVWVLTAGFLRWRRPSQARS